MKVIIAGGRHFDDYEKLKSDCDKILSNTKVDEIVSGGASGADSLGEKYALSNNHQIRLRPKKARILHTSSLDPHSRV